MAGALAGSGKSGYDALASAGAGSGLAVRQQDERAITLAKMRADIANAMLASREKQEMEQLVGSLYKDVSSTSGEGGLTADPEVARQIAMRTRDPAILQSVIATQRDKRIKDAKAGAFKPTQDESGKVSYQFDPSATAAILSAGGDFNDIAAIAKAIPELRRAGMLGGAAVQGTPFDAIALMAPTPALKLHADRLQKQYLAGAFKDEDAAEKQAQQLLQLITSGMDRQQQMQFQQAMQGMMLGLRQQGLQLQQETQQERLDALRSKLTDQQKIDYSKVIVPVMNEGTKASSAIMQLQGLENVINKAPSGVIEGVAATTVGSLFGTDANTAMRELERIQKSLLAQIPRLPGSQSNFDAQNLERALGKLTDVKLTNSQRIELIKSIKSDFTRLADRAYEASVYWDTNKKVMPALFVTERPDKAKTKQVVRSGTVTSGPNAGKTVYEYSDGTKEYK
jgi:hypothetical protein